MPTKRANDAGNTDIPVADRHTHKAKRREQDRPVIFHSPQKPDALRSPEVTMPKVNDLNYFLSGADRTGTPVTLPDQTVAASPAIPRRGPTGTPVTQHHDTNSETESDDDVALAEFGPTGTPVTRHEQDANDDLDSSEDETESEDDAEAGYQTPEQNIRKFTPSPVGFTPGTSDFYHKNPSLNGRPNLLWQLPGWPAGAPNAHHDQETAARCRSR